MKKRYIIGGVILVIVIVFLYWQDNSIEVTNYDITSEKILETFDGKKIVQISDLHNKNFGTDNEDLIEKVKEIHPYAILLTGDIIDASHTDIESAVNTCKSLMFIAPCYYVNGNHELAIGTTEYQKLLDAMKTLGVIDINDQMRKLGSGISFIGLSDINLGNTQRLNDLMDKTGTTFTILLAHEPQYIWNYANNGVDLVLAGHTHGGQIRIPFTNQGLYVPDQGILPKYCAGEYTMGDTEMIISRGLGNSVFPFRVFNRPELVVLTLHSGE